MRHFRLVVFASHEGSNFEAILKSCRSSFLPASVEALITHNPLAVAIKRAKKHQIPFHCLSPEDFVKEKKLLDILEVYQPDFLILAGLVKKLGKKVLQKYKAINTHPSLLPKYGGQGMYGLKVYEKVIQSGDKETGITIHRVNSEYDKGEILSQIKIPVLESDTAESLQERLKSFESKFYIETLKKIMTNELNF